MTEVKNDGAATSDPRFAELDQLVANKLESMVSEGLCSARDIDDKVLDQLRMLAPSDAVDSLSKLESAARASSVRKTSAYLAGVIRRVAQAPQGRSTTGADELFPPARAVLDRLISGGALRKGELDYKSLQVLAGKPPEMQLLVMETFRDRNLYGIRNMAAFFTSHVSQVERDLRDGRLQLPVLGPPPKYDPGFYPPHHPQSSRYETPPYDPSYGRPGGPRPRGGGGQTPPYGPPPDVGGAVPHGGAYQQQPPGNASTYPSGPPPSLMQPPPQHQQQQPDHPPLIGAHVPAAVPPSIASAAPITTRMTTAPPPQAMPKHYGVEQVQWGVRVDEFQSLSPFAKYVHPAAALRLQQLWDAEQNKLVSVLNETSWEQLAGLDAASGINAVNEVAEAMKTAPDDIATINAIFLTTVAKFPKRPDAPTAASIGHVLSAAAAAAAAAAGPLPLPAVAMTARPPPAATPQQPQPYGAPPPAAGGPPPAGSYGRPPMPGGAYEPPPQYNTGGPPPGGQTGPPPAPYGTAPPVQLPGPCGTLPPAVQTAIDRILVQWGGLLKLDHFDERAVDILDRIGERYGLQALDEFGRNNPAHMRNPNAYLLGCLRKYEAPDGGYDPRDRRSDTGGRSSYRGPSEGGRRGGRGRGRGRGGGRRYEPY